MNDAERKVMEERLLKEREHAVRALQRLDETREGEADGDLTNYPLHMADEGTDTIEREKELALLGAEGERLNAIDNALRKLYREPETFGSCERCGAPIERERLELVPWARYCVRCQQIIESGE